ncbi:hypothetical protein JW859_08365, partial [bacterium]|nr:hypothetical protein [bacterium]
TSAHGEDNYAIPATEDYVIVSGSADKLAWAIYTIDELEANRPVGLEITVEPAPAEPGGTEDLPLSCWIGISDYTNFCWEWSGPYADTGSLVLNSEEIRDRYVTSDYLMSFAVLTVTASTFVSASNPDGLTAALINVAETTTLAATDEDYHSTKPHYAAIEEVTLGAKSASALDPDTQYVHLDWVHYYDAASDDNEALQYKIYRQGPDDADRVPIGSVNAPEITYCDPLDNATGVAEPLPGVTYTYFLRAYNPAGYTPYDAAPVTIPDGPTDPDVIVITDFTVRIDNAANGIGFDPELFDAQSNTGAIPANEDTSVEVEWIDGTFNGLPFSGNDSANWPEGMTEDDYGEALGAAHAELVWTADHDGDENMRRTGDWFRLSGDPYPAFDPPPGLVFPDYDPESDAAAPEGLLDVVLPDDLTVTYPVDEDLEVKVPTAIQFTIEMDVLSDPAAPVILGIEDDLGDPIEEFFILDEEIHAYLPLSWGVGGAPADLSTIELELHGFEAEAGPSLGSDVEFAYTAGTPDVGEFTVDTSGDPFIHCVFSGLNMQGWYETFRVNVDGVWSTINLPTDLVLVVVPQMEQELVTFPAVCWPDVDVIQIFYADPKIRRCPGLVFNIVEYSVDPEDPVGYNDILKTNGDEFSFSMHDKIYPDIVLVETADPATIEYNDPDELTGVIPVEYNSGRICVDIAVLTVLGQPGDPTRTISYRLFESDQTPVGCGTFTIEPLGSLLAAPTGVDWGINVWDREAKAIADRTYDDFTLDGAAVGTATPDVLWFELKDGWFFDFDQIDNTAFRSTDSSSNDNVKIRFEDAADGSYMYADCSLRIAELGADPGYIALFVPSIYAFKYPGIPGWPGIFETGHTYSIQLEDIHYAGIEHTFANSLIVVGTNPNT